MCERNECLAIVNVGNNVVQGVLSYEERLKRAREDVRNERAKHDATLASLEFWRTRAKELEAKLQMYEGKEVEHDPDIARMEDAYVDTDKNDRAVMSECHGDASREGRGMAEHGQQFHGAHARPEPSHGKQGVMEERQMVDPALVGGTTVTGDSGCAGYEEEVALSVGEEGGEKCGLETEFPSMKRGRCEDDYLHDSVDLRVGREMDVKAVDSAAPAPHGEGELSNPSTCSICSVEECGVYVLRQDMAEVEERVGGETSAIEEGLQVQMTPGKGTVKFADVEVGSQQQGQSSSHIVKRMKLRPRKRRPAFVRGSPYLQSYWRRYRKTPRKLGTANICAESGYELGHAACDAVVPARAAGVEWAVVGPLPFAMLPRMSTITLSEQVMKHILN